MQLTEEQLKITATQGNIRINAVAGSGKTTTLIAYAKSRPEGSRILYLAFNKTVRQEATLKFVEAGLPGVVVETAHSLAFRKIVAGSRYKVRQSYKTHEIVEILKLKRGNGDHFEYIIANHINRLVAYFCNSSVSKVQQLNYLDTVTDETARQFVEANYQDISHNARILLSMMDRAEIEVTHDFYLKKYQLSKPVIACDYILFDEAQDASPVMLDVFFRQQAIKVMVGDTHQQIYRWRYAVNSLDQSDYPVYSLTTSFRFPQSIAALATETLAYKKKMGVSDLPEIRGMGKFRSSNTKAIIARTNLGLLLRAIDIITGSRKKPKVYFEGNFHSYTYAEEGTSLYDVLNLSNDNRHLIRDPLLKGMRNVSELEEYIEKTDDKQMAMMLELVEEHGNRIHDMISEIKLCHVDDRLKADFIFSTVHRCKGMEYDEVELVNDFISEDKFRKLWEVQPDEAALTEEINLLYVAMTRTRYVLNLDPELMPDGFVPSEGIRVKLLNTRSPERETMGRMKPVRKNVAQGPEYAYKKWTNDEDDELSIMYGDGISIAELADHFGRSKGIVWARIRKLGLSDEW